VKYRLPGLATHLRLYDRVSWHTACGTHSEHTTTDPLQVDCANCRRTRIFAARVNKRRTT
jgi:hypothetical protein